MQNPSVFIIVLNWNNYEDTAECLTSLSNLSYLRYQVILVDNASTDGSAQRLRREFPHVHTIINQENLGFAAGCNVGIKYSLENGADAVLLINNDAILEPRSLEPAVQTLFSDRKIGIVGGKIKNYFRRDYIDSVGVRHILWPIGFMRSEGTGKFDQGQFEDRTKLAATSGALMLIKRKVFNAIGLLSESFFLGGEDVDFCLSARGKGFKVIYEPQFIAYHKVGRSHSELTPGWIYNNLLSKQLIMKKHLRPFWWRANKLCFWFYARYWLLQRYKRRIQREKPKSTSIPELLQEIEHAIRAAFKDSCVKKQITLDDLQVFHVKSRQPDDMD